MHIKELKDGTVINLTGKALYIFSLYSFGFFAIWLHDTIGDNFYI